MSNVNNWLNLIKTNEIHTYNRVSSRDLAICFNFLQIPDTETVMITMTVMKNKVKKNALDPQSFAKVMKCVEQSLSDTYWGNPKKFVNDSDYFSNLKSKLSNDWYIYGCCHRVFFIPENALFDTIQVLFNQENVRTLKACNITEVAAFINTENYDFNAKFY